MPAAAAYIASCSTIALLPLTFSVMRLRMVTGTGIGDGGHERLASAIRVHANYAENIPFGVALLLLLAADRQPGVGGSRPGTCSLIIGRAAHAAGPRPLRQATSPARGMGIMLTQFSLLFGAAQLCPVAGLGVFNSFAHRQPRQHSCPFIGLASSAPFVKNSPSTRCPLREASVEKSGEDPP